jgi:catechol 2,3-dioxygenase-like lactoylglutathione lyase family enzyme
MQTLRISSICGVIITTGNLERMVDFYQRVLGLPLEKEEHGELDIHYGVDLGALHFAIHPLSDFGETTPGNAAVKIAFTVDSLKSYVSRLAAEGYQPVQAPHDEGFGPVASFRDPDDNLIELVELRYEFKSIG